LAGAGRGDGPLVVKALGTDPLGRRITAWAELDLPPAEDLARDDAGRP